MLPQLTPLAQELAQTRRELLEAVEQATVGSTDRASLDGQYSPREILAHLAGAERGMTGLMRLMAAGQNPRLRPDYDNNVYNARQQEKRAGKSIRELRAELETSRAELLQFMENLTEEALTRRGEHPTAGDASVLEVLERLRDHEREHTAELLGQPSRT